MTRARSGRARGGALRGGTPVQETRLASGCTLLTWPFPGLATAAVALAAPAGARHEETSEHGLAHLFEHMLFKGTERRTARQVAEEIEDVGGELNAWTSREATLLHARVMGEHVPLALDLMADLVCAARFSDTDLLLERGVVLSEIGDAEDNPEDVAWDLLQAIAYPGQTIGRPILGTAESLEQLSVRSLQEWRARHWSPEGAVIAVAGAVDHPRVVAQCEQLFAARPPTERCDFALARFSGGGAHRRRRTEQQVSLLGLAAPGLDGPERRAATLFAAALGGGMSSRLFQEIREDRGLAYSVDASHLLHADCGLLAMHAATRPDHAGEVIARMQETGLKAATDLTPAELERARAQMRAAMLMGLEGCAGAADWAARSWLAFGRVVRPAEAVAELDAVTLDEVRASGLAMLAGTPAIATVGPRRVRGIAAA
ncbi:MAG: M16 family metallopeptidase [Thermaurantiacus sp.]